MSKIEIILTAEETKKFNLKGKTAVIIDVLRASTTITILLEKGVKGITPVTTIEEAFKVREKLKKEKNQGEILLMGERNGIKPQGFDYGNSPTEIYAISSRVLQDKWVILTTTNGTKAINYSKDANTIVIASMRNLPTVTKFLSNEKNQIVIVCSGTNSQFTVEDFYTGGMIIKELLNSHTPFNDITWLAATIAETPLEKVINDKTCFHLKKLIEIGFKHDVEFALTIGNSPILPVYNIPKNLIVSN